MERIELSARHLACIIRRDLVRGHYLPYTVVSDTLQARVDERLLYEIVIRRNDGKTFKGKYIFTKGAFYGQGWGPDVVLKEDGYIKYERSIGHINLGSIDREEAKEVVQ